MALSHSLWQHNLCSAVQPTLLRRAYFSTEMTDRFSLQTVMCCNQLIHSSSWIFIYLTTRLLTCLIGRYSFKSVLVLLSACHHSCLPYFASCLIILSLPPLTRHGSLFVPFRACHLTHLGYKERVGGGWMNIKAILFLFVLDVVWEASQFYDIFFTVSLIWLYAYGIRIKCWYWQKCAVGWIGSKIWHSLDTVWYVKCMVLSVDRIYEQMEL